LHYYILLLNGCINYERNEAIMHVKYAVKTFLTQ